MKMKKIEIYMNAIQLENPMINFLKELVEHSKLFYNYKIDIKYQIE